MCYIRRDSSTVTIDRRDLGALFPSGSRHAPRIGCCAALQLVQASAQLDHHACSCGNRLPSLKNTESSDVLSNVTVLSGEFMALEVKVARYMDAWTKSFFLWTNAHRIMIYIAMFRHFSFQGHKFTEGEGSDIGEYTRISRVFEFFSFLFFSLLRDGIRSCMNKISNWSPQLHMCIIRNVHWGSTGFFGKAGRTERRNLAA